MGPGHGNYAVELTHNQTGTVFVKSGLAPTLQPRQLLWSSNVSENSLVIITSMPMGDDTWFDLDYIAYTSNST